MKLRTGALLISLAAASAMAQTGTIHSRYSLSTASSASMERIIPMTGMNRTDMIFLADMARVSMAEIQLGQLAQRQGGDWGKSFGKDMEREHRMALEELKLLATDQGISLPKDINLASKKAYNRLSHLSGAAFDSAYQQMMISGHEAVLAEVRNEIRYGHNEKSRNYAVTLEPEVKTHLNLALKGGSMMDGGG